MNSTAARVQVWKDWRRVPVTKRNFHLLKNEGQAFSPAASEHDRHRPKET